MAQLLPLTTRQKLPTLLRREAVLRFFLGNVQFQQHIDDTPVALCLLVDFAQELHRVYSMYQANIRGDILHLVGLQMADEVPLHILRHLLHFLLQFLHVTLAEDALTGIVGLAQHLHRMELADCYESDARRQVGQHRFQVFCYLAHLVPLI